MCGAVKFENNSRLVPNNSYIPQKNLSTELDKDVQVQWKGWARIDGSADGKRSFTWQWSAKEWKVVRIRATEFTEKNANEHVTKFKTMGKEICAIMNKKGELKILTRPARANEQKAAHRMPITTSMGKKFHLYMNKKLKGQYSE